MIMVIRATLPDNAACLLYHKANTHILLSNQISLLWANPLRHAKVSQNHCHNICAPLSRYIRAACGPAARCGSRRVGVLGLGVVLCGHFE